MPSARTAVNAGLALLAAALAAWLVFKPTPGQEQSAALLVVDAAAVDRIRLQRAGLPPLELARVGGDWRLTAPIAARADAIKVERLLEVARARATATFPAEELAQYDLQPPAAELALGAATLAFGMLNPVTSQQYVLAGDRVHAVSPRHFAALPLTADDLISRALLAPGETLTALELPGVSARRGEAGWSLDGAPAAMSRDDINVWVDRWRHAIAADAAALDKAADPRADGALLLEDGRRAPIAVERSDAGVFVTRIDERVRYRFPPEVGAAMLTPPEPER
ncbi:MAG TPA: DUF4340 domain-containing protein [Pelomicrobium sp.]|nr:DUF4340 domain-containing protein [Pelomicrobium sp.]